MKNIYLGAAIVGTIIPYFFFLRFFADHGFSLSSFASALFVNGAAGGFASDILISSAVFWIYLFQEKEKRAWLYIALNLSIGLSCALPFYLYEKTKNAEA
ncbi:MAG: hypothetical protein ACI9FB_001753 [Candidatus Azotimanducaceae bacterium]|jgi:hypothetical protein